MTAAPGSAYTKAIEKLATALTPPEPRAKGARGKGLVRGVAPAQTNTHPRPEPNKKRSLLGLFGGK